MEAEATPHYSMSFPLTAQIPLLEMLNDVSDETLDVATIVVWALIVALVPACFYLFRTSSRPVRHYGLEQHSAMTRLKREEFVSNPTNSDHEAQRKKLQDELSKSQMHLRRSQEELVELRKDVGTKETDATSLKPISQSQQQNQDEEDGRRIWKLKKQIEETNAALKKSVEDVVTAKEAASALEETNKQLEQEQRTAEGQAAKQKEVRAKLNKELAVVRRDLQTTHEKLGDREEESRDLKSEIESLREAKEETEKRTAQDKQAHEEQEHELSVTKTDLDQALKRISITEEEVQELRAANDSLQEFIKAGEEKTAEDENTREVLQKKLAAVELNMEEMRKKLFNAEREVQDLKNKRTSLREAEGRREKRESTEKSAWERLNSELPVTRPELEEMRKKLSARQTEIENLESENQDLREAKKAADRNVAQAQADQEDAEDERETSERRLLERIRELEQMQITQARLAAPPTCKSNGSNHALFERMYSQSLPEGLVPHIDLQEKPVVQLPQPPTARPSHGTDVVRQETSQFAPVDISSKPIADIISLVADATPSQVQDLDNEVCYYTRHDETTGRRHPCRMHANGKCVGNPKEYFTDGKYSLDLTNNTHDYFGGMVDEWENDSTEEGRTTDVKNDDAKRWKLARDWGVCRWCIIHYDPNPRSLPPKQRLAPGDRPLFKLLGGKA